MSEPTLEDARWELLELRGQAIDTEATPYLEMNPAKGSAYGFGGCNRFFGSYEASDGAIRFGNLGATRMACPEGMEQEQELFRALGSTTRYAIEGSELLLFAGDTQVARFLGREKPREP